MDRKEINIWDTIQIYYYLILSDGNVGQEEMEKIREIVQKTSVFPRVSDDKLNEFIESCNDHMTTALDKKGRYDAIIEGIDNIINKPSRSLLGYINIKLFLWNLLSIAVCDKEYIKEEREIIEYVVKRLDIDKEIFLEMENSIKAITEIDKSIAWLSDNKKPFVLKFSDWELNSSEEVEIIDKLMERQKVIFDGVKVLIED